MSPAASAAMPHPLRVRAGLLLGISMLGGCSSWFGGEEEPPLPGTRISVLELERAIEPDPQVANIDIVLPSAVLEPDWPQVGSRPDHMPGHRALPASLRRAWSTDIGEGGGGDSRLLTPPVVVDGRIYAMDAGGYVAAFDTDRGRRVWRVRAASPAEDSDPLGGGVAFGDGRIYVTTGFGEVMALDPANGGLLWRAEANGPIRSAPTYASGRVFVISIDNQVEALDATTGELLWSHTGILEDAALLGGASPAAGAGVVIVPYSSGELFALRQETGRPAWSDSLATIRRFGALAGLADVRGNPVMADDLVIAISHSGRMAAIDLRSGARVWEQEIGGINMPLVAGEFVFVVTVNAELVALTKRGGRILWVTPLPRYRNPSDRIGPLVWAGPVLGGDRLIVVGSNGDAMLVSPYSGEILDTFGVSGSTTIAPVIANGTLYVLSDNAQLAAYR
ncbi:MAG: PQQ-binding-like beta-propeller repeat protein [Inquilinus sp.]|nr:PQQ-binding-like beta-propeller repeat protein [Inquilinus sp.]